jgi:hypothetical protein
MLLELKNEELKVGGTGIAKLFEWNKKPVDLPAGELINRLI